MITWSVLRLVKAGAKNNILQLFSQENSPWKPFIFCTGCKHKAHCLANRYSVHTLDCFRIWLKSKVFPPTGWFTLLRGGLRSGRRWWTAVEADIAVEFPEGFLLKITYLGPAYHVWASTLLLHLQVHLRTALPRVELQIGAFHFQNRHRVCTVFLFYKPTFDSEANCKNL